MRKSKRVGRFHEVVRVGQWSKLEVIRKRRYANPPLAPAQQYVLTHASCLVRSHT